jgi:hypothetical protein
LTRACALIVASLAGCIRPGAYHCTQDSQCVNGGTIGVCEPSVGYCGFPDDKCGGGYRFGDQSGAYSNQCVGDGHGGDGGLPDAPPGFARIGGMVSGLAGAGLVLRDNGGDDLLITASGPFAFKTAIKIGDPYAVTIAAAPATQTCTVANASGNAPMMDVTNVAVKCTTDPGILCGTTYCDPATQVCCVSGGVPTCQSGCNGGGRMPFHCDDHQDCVIEGLANDVCCGDLSGTMVTRSYCTTAATCQSPHAYFCDPTVPTPCPDGGSCMPTSAPFPGWYRCF